MILEHNLLDDKTVQYKGTLTLRYSADEDIEGNAVLQEAKDSGERPRKPIQQDFHNQ